MNTGNLIYFLKRFLGKYDKAIE